MSADFDALFSAQLAHLQTVHDVDRADLATEEDLLTTLSEIAAESCDDCADLLSDAIGPCDGCRSRGPHQCRVHAEYYN